MTRPVPAPGRPRRAPALFLALGLLGPAAAAAEPGCAEGRPLATGLCLSAEATLDGFAGVAGGLRRGVAAIGQVRLGLSADLGPLAGLDGWSVHVGGVGLLGRQPTPTLAGSLAPVSNIEALPTFRLFEAWVERDLAGWGSLRLGRLAADSEFATAEAAGTLVNGTFGWPVALAAALPSGGPAYPLATPGARLALGDPAGGTGLRLGLFAGDPGGRYGAETDPQRHDRHGTILGGPGGLLYMAEVVTGAAAPPDAGGPRPWVAKLGGWHHTGGFDAVRLDEGGVSLADPAGSGTPRRFANNQGGYAVAEAVLWRGEDGHVAVFARGFAQPGDRNAVALQLDAGLAWRGPFGRAADTLALGLSRARIGAASRGLDRDLVAFGAARPVRSHETVVELAYDLALVPDRLALRPLMQLLLNPAAGEPDARRDPARALPDAVLLGLRAVASF